MDFYFFHILNRTTQGISRENTRAIHPTLCGEVHEAALSFNLNERTKDEGLPGVSQASRLQVGCVVGEGQIWLQPHGRKCGLVIDPLC